MSRINLFKESQRGYTFINVVWEFGKVLSYQLFYSKGCAMHNHRDGQDYCLPLDKAALRWPETFGWCE